MRWQRAAPGETLRVCWRCSHCLLKVLPLLTINTVVDLHSVSAAVHSVKFSKSLIFFFSCLHSPPQGMWGMTYLSSSTLLELNSNAVQVNVSAHLSAGCQCASMSPDFALHVCASRVSYQLMAMYVQANPPDFISASSVIYPPALHGPSRHDRAATTRC